MTPPIRRRIKPFLGNAQIAPIRVRRENPQPIDLPPTAHRRYVLGQVDAGKVRWYPRTGWRLDGSMCNAVIRDMVRAGWLTEAGDAAHRTLTVTDAGRGHLPEAPGADV